MACMTSDVERLGATIAWSLVDLTWGATAMVGGLGYALYELEAGSNHPCGSTFSGSCKRYFQKEYIKCL